MTHSRFESVKLCCESVKKFTNKIWLSKTHFSLIQTHRTLQQKLLALVVWMLPWNKVLCFPDLRYETSSAVDCFDSFAAKTIEGSLVL